MFRVRSRYGLLILLVAVFLFYVSLSSYYMRISDGGFTAFLHVGERFYDPAYFPTGTRVCPNEGYDGQFYCYVALDPFIHGKLYRQIDSPAYRYQRVLYPLISALLSVGRKKWLPFMMWFVNVMAVVGSTYYI